jgi:hypothetical protein
MLDGGGTRIPALRCGFHPFLCMRRPHLPSGRCVLPVTLGLPPPGRTFLVFVPALPIFLVVRCGARARSVRRIAGRRGRGGYRCSSRSSFGALMRGDQVAMASEVRSRDTAGILFWVKPCTRGGERWYPLTCIKARN